MSGSDPAALVQGDRVHRSVYTDPALFALAGVRGALAASGARADAVAAIGFGATCSLVARDASGAPLSIAEDGAPGWDTIAWCDHRAEAEVRCRPCRLAYAVRDGIPVMLADEARELTPAEYER